MAPPSPGAKVTVSFVASRPVRVSVAALAFVGRTLSVTGPAARAAFFAATTPLPDSEITPAWLTTTFSCAVPRAGSGFSFSTRIVPGAGGEGGLGGGVEDPPPDGGGLNGVESESTATPQISLPPVASNFGTTAVPSVLARPIVPLPLFVQKSWAPRMASPQGPAASPIRLGFGNWPVLLARPICVPFGKKKPVFVQKMLAR